MHYVYCTLRELKEFLKLLTIQVAVTKNFGEQSRPNGFARVNWHDCRAAIRVMNKMMAAFDAEQFKASLFQDRQKFLASQAGNRCHAATEMR
jgi:hypothetical protein